MFNIDLSGKLARFLYFWMYTLFRTSDTGGQPRYESCSLSTASWTRQTHRHRDTRTNVGHLHDRPLLKRIFNSTSFPVQGNQINTPLPHPSAWGRLFSQDRHYTELSLSNSLLFCLLLHFRIQLKPWHVCLVGLMCMLLCEVLREVLQGHVACHYWCPRLVKAGNCLHSRRLIAFSLLCAEF